MNTDAWTNSYGQNAPAMVISAMLLLAALAVLGMAHNYSWPLAYILGVALLLAAGLLPFSLLVAKQMGEGRRAAIWAIACNPRSGSVHGRALRGLRRRLGRPAHSNH